MPGCEPEVFEGVTDAMLECLSQTVKSAFGISIEGDAGNASAMGATLQWQYDRGAGRLTITCTERPIFLPCEMIYSQFGKMLDRCRG